MNAQRFIAPNSREAMAQAKAVFGDSAVILSSRSTNQGFEVVATAEEHLAGITTRTAEEAAPASQAADRSRLSFEQRAARQLPALSSRTSVAQDTEIMAMSTLSFQDYVRERMLRKRQEALKASSEPAAPARSSAPVPPPRSKADEAVPSRVSPAPSVVQSASVSQPARKAVASAEAAAKSPAAAAGARLTDQIDGLKALMEERFNTLAWLGQTKQSPMQSTLLLKLIRSGYSPAVARAVMERLPERYGANEAFQWTQEVLARNLRTSRDAGHLCDEGGIFALIGSTGVGKTTTAAKLAAQCVQAYGANSVGLITLDTYRVAGYEQLRAYGRMLGVVAHLAHDRAALADLLELLANKRMVIIDTAGLGHKDARIRDMMALLDAPSIKKLLVLNAGAHGDTLDEVVHAYQGHPLHGVILSKVDEAAKLGPAIDTLIRHQLVLRGLSTGQRVPEDWQRPESSALIRLSMATSGKSPYDPQETELPLFYADAAGGRVQLDGRHA
jgi:flagellar biosynthesis protein FlhF